MASDTYSEIMDAIVADRLHSGRAGRREPAEGVEDVANKFSGPFERTVLPGVGHFPQREDPDAVTQILIGLFSKA